MEPAQPWHAPSPLWLLPLSQPPHLDVTEPETLTARNRTRVSARYGAESYIPPSPAEPSADACVDVLSTRTPRALCWNSTGMDAQFQSPALVCRELLRACAKT